jgi:hypothetical protein
MLLLLSAALLSLALGQQDKPPPMPILQPLGDRDHEVQQAEAAAFSARGASLGAGAEAGAGGRVAGLLRPRQRSGPAITVNGRAPPVPIPIEEDFSDPNLRRECQCRQCCDTCKLPVHAAVASGISLPAYAPEPLRVQATTWTQRASRVALWHDPPRRTAPGRAPAVR